MKTLLLAGVAALAISATATAAPLIADGITYNLTMTATANPLVESFSLAITCGWRFESPERFRRGFRRASRAAEVSNA